MRQAVLALFVVFAIGASASVPTSAAEFRKVPGQNGSADRQLRSTPDIDNGNGEVNTDPAMTSSTGENNAGKPTTTTGNSCRNGGGQNYPNANTDNPAGFQPCPQ